MQFVRVGRPAERDFALSGVEMGATGGGGLLTEIDSRYYVLGAHAVRTSILCTCV